MAGTTHREGGILAVDSSGMISRQGMFGNGHSRTTERQEGKRRRLGLRPATSLLAIAGIAAVIALALVPADQSVATPTREGTCGCHPTGADALLTVTGLPDTTYDPGITYTITITVDDTNGDTGENSFSMDVVGGGTISSTDPNVEINTETQASANDGVAPMTTSSWTVEWVAPSAGSVTFTVNAVVSGVDTGNDAPTDSDAIALNANEIPEFPALAVPLIGIVASVFIAARLTKKRR